tara:strand:+ start:8540 stop:9733 length:1194 start_codon:yes stop_codon:yes gene_type:complete
MLKDLFKLTNLQIFSTIFSFILSIFIANELEPNNFGLYSKALIWGNLLSMIGSFETDRTAAVLQSKLKNSQEVFNIVITVRLIFFLLFILYIPFLLYYNLAIGFGVLVICLTVFNLSFLYEILEKNVNYGIVFFFERAIYIVLCLAFFILFNSLNLYLIFFAYGLGTLFSLFWQFRRYKPYFKKFVLKKFDEIKPVIINNSFIVSIALSEFAYGGFSRLILENKFGLEIMGIYSAGWYAIMLITIFQAQVTKVWRLKISDSLINKAGGLKPVIKKYFYFSTIPVCILSIALILFAPAIVDFLFIEDYKILSSLLPVFACYFVIINLHTLTTIFWVSIGDKKEFLLTNLISSISLIIVLMYFPKELGINFFAATTIFFHGLVVFYLLKRFYFKYLRSS